MSIYSSGRERQNSSLYKSVIANSHYDDNVVEFENKSRQADAYYQQAMDLCDQQSLSELKTDPLILASIHDALVLATKLGSVKAPMLLVEHALKGLFCEACHQENTLALLKIAAERHHPKAIYYLGVSYAGTGEFPSIEALLKLDSTLHAKERERLAVHYLMLGAEQQHQASLDALLLGYAYGWPYVSKETSRLLLLGKQCVEQGNAAVTLVLGAWLIGYTIEGEQIPEDLRPLSINMSLGLEYLLTTSRHQDLYLATSALTLISCALAKGDLSAKWVSTIVSDALKGNDLLALYLAWYSLPKSERPSKPAVIQSCQCLGFARVFLPSYEKATFYFEAANKSKNEIISRAAKSLSQAIFSGYVKILNDLRK